MVDDGPAQPGEQGALGRRFRVVPEDEHADYQYAEFIKDEHAQRLVPRSIKAVLAVVGVEILVLLLVLAYLVSTVVQDVSPDRRMTWATVAFAVVLLFGLVVGGFAVLRGRRWGRAPLMAHQILQAASAAPALVSSNWSVAAGLVALSLLGLVALLSPGVTRHLSWREIPGGSRFF